MSFGISSAGSAAANSARTQQVQANASPTGTRQHWSAEQLSHAKAFLERHAMPADHLKSVVFVKGMTGHGWIVDRARENGNPAITRGNVVYVRDDYWAMATDATKEVFWSEIFHTSQYQLGNFESHYLSGMIGSLLIGGDGHRGNIMETVAHNRGEKMAKLWNARN